MYNLSSKQDTRDLQSESKFAIETLISSSLNMEQDRLNNQYKFSLYKNSLFDRLCKIEVKTLVSVNLFVLATIIAAEELETRGGRSSCLF